MTEDSGAKLEGSDVVFQTKIMNEHLICSLCMGYLRDAQTVTECLHTFCKTCIYRHLGDNGFCPTCEVDLCPTPKEKIRSDRAMQNIVDKVFPHFAREEAAAEKNFKGENETGKHKATEQISAQAEAKRKKVAQTVASKRKAMDKEASSTIPKICMSLQPGVDEKGENLAPKLQQPFLRSSVDATVKQYKLYLTKKLADDHGVNMTGAEIVLSVKGTVLKESSTFGEVWKEMWGLKDDLAVEYVVKSKGE